MEELAALFKDSDSLFTIFAVVSSIAAVLSIGMPLLDRTSFQDRMRAVALERDRIRQRGRDRLAKEARGSLRAEAKPFIKDLVERYKLQERFGFEDMQLKLKMAGFRGEAPVSFFLVLRVLVPVAVLFVSVVYLFIIDDSEQSLLFKCALALGFAFIGYQLPRLYLTNAIQKRQHSMQRAFPEALDLMLVCVEAGMAMEPALRKVSEEIGKRSIPLAEEMTLTTAELSYLQERKMALENFATRTGLESIKSVTIALIQSEKYGTGLSQTLRVLAQESRDMRMAEAEKKAASLPPKLTVPMMLFFFPVLFIFILGPAILRVMDLS